MRDTVRAFFNIEERILHNSENGLENAKQITNSKCLPNYHASGFVITCSKHTGNEVNVKYQQQHCTRWTTLAHSFS